MIMPENEQGSITDWFPISRFVDLNTYLQNPSEGREIARLREEMTIHEAPPQGGEVLALRLVSWFRRAALSVQRLSQALQRRSDRLYYRVRSQQRARGYALWLQSREGLPQIDASLKRK